MKIVIWVIPALLLICWVERQRPSQFLQLHHMGKGFAWGGIAGVVLIGINLVAAIFFSKSHFHIPTFSVVLLNAVLIAPLVEEITL